MDTVILWILVVAVSSFVLTACGLIAALIFAFKLRRLHRRQFALLKGMTDDLNAAYVGGQLAYIGQQLGRLTRSLNAAGIVSGAASDIILGPADTYERLDQGWDSIQDVTDREESSCLVDGDRRRTAVIVVLGQSNAANHGAGRYVARRQVDNFNIYDGKCYRAADPLLGASGDGGNFATRLGDKLIDAGVFDRVILAPIAMGGTTVEQWAEEGMFNRRIPVLVRRLYDAGLSADFILWQQGEGNQGNGDVGGRQYRKNLLEVICTFRGCGATVPFFVSLTTTCGGPHANADNIRAGQKGVVNPAAAIYQGPDTDLIGVEHRWDACHFNEVGLDMAASLWLEVIASHFRPVQDSVKARSGKIERVGGS